MFRREKVAEILKSFKVLHFPISHSTLVYASLLTLILFLAFTVRLLPLRWGFYLSEFDPHWHYRLTKHMVDKGLLTWASGWSMADPSRDMMSWYPWGRDIAGTSFPGLALTAAFFYQIANALGLSFTFSSNVLVSDPVYNFCVIFPVIMGTLTCLVMYFLGKDIGGKQAGLFSAFFLALSPSFIGRTSLGFFDDESVGIFAILLFILFFLRSIEPERALKNSFVYAAAAGLSLGYMSTSWGASRYPIGMAVLFVFILILLRRYSSRLLLSYSTTFSVALFISINVPWIGLKYLTETTILAVLGIFLLLCLYEVSRYIEALKMKTVFVLGFFAFLAVFFIALSHYGYIMPLGAKFESVLNPFERLAYPLVQSVQEHRPAGWGSFYYDFGIGVFFVPIGLFFAMRTPTNRNLFLIIFGLTSIYFAGSMVRLVLLMAPAFCLLWALALVRLIKPFTTVIKEAPIIPRRKMRFQAYVGKEFSGVFLIIIFLLLSLTFVLPTQLSPYPRVFDQAYSPTTIASGSMPIKPPEPVSDWIDTLKWMRDELPLSPPYGPTVVVSWWDYGYWITALGNKTTLADNGTFNSTQIKQIAWMFMSDETRAIEILEQNLSRPTHVVVFTTFYPDEEGNIIEVGWGDEGKWRWMARISEPLTRVNDTAYRQFEPDPETGALQDVGWNERGLNTVIYKLMRYGQELLVFGVPQSVTLDHFEKAYFSQTGDSPRSYGGAIPLVCVYKINYET